MNNEVKKYIARVVGDAFAREYREGGAVVSFSGGRFWVATSFARVDRLAMGRLDRNFQKNFGYLPPEEWRMRVEVDKYKIQVGWMSETIYKVEFGEKEKEGEFLLHVTTVDVPGKRLDGVTKTVEVSREDIQKIKERLVAIYEEDKRKREEERKKYWWLYETATSEEEK